MLGSLVIFIIFSRSTQVMIIVQKSSAAFTSIFFFSFIDTFKGPYIVDGFAKILPRSNRDFILCFCFQKPRKTPFLKTGKKEQLVGSFYRFNFGLCYLVVIWFKENMLLNWCSWSGVCTISSYYWTFFFNFIIFVLVQTNSIPPAVRLFC